jgi:hypothetical protein
MQKAQASVRARLNHHTARTLGLRVPLSLLAPADEVIVDGLGSGRKQPHLFRPRPRFSIMEKPNPSRQLDRDGE